jgi:hypothetical protein
MSSFDPMTTVGTPGNATPRTSSESPLSPRTVRCCSYQTGGTISERCGSFATIGLPSSV